MSFKNKIEHPSSTFLKGDGKRAMKMLSELL